MSCSDCEIPGRSSFAFHSSHNSKALRGLVAIRWGSGSLVAWWCIRGQTVGTVVCGRRLFDLLRPYSTPPACSRCCCCCYQLPRYKCLCEVVFYVFGSTAQRLKPADMRNFPDCCLFTKQFTTLFFLLFDNNVWVSFLIQIVINLFCCIHDLV